MIITKIETNFRRKLFFYETKIDTLPYSETIEFQVIKLYSNISYQAFLGFGGAFTESTGYAISLLNSELQEKILDEYFGENGINYLIGRLPIGSCDFSLESYSYANENNLSDFSIEKDNKYILPIIREAQNRNPKLQFLASPWSPPSFMKSNHNLYHGGKLLPEYKKVWAQYIAKYVLAYQKEGIQIQYLTVQNEPTASQTWESCLYTAEEEADFIKNYLFPTFQSYGIKTKILIWDQNKDKIVERASSTLMDNASFNQVDGIAFHWYTGDHFEALKIVRELFPNKLLFHTEGCTGYSNFEPKEEVKNAEIYGHDIINDLNAGINAFIDWNLVLDEKGGPNHKNNYCNSPIMIQKKKKNYNKNLSFYYIAHFSKFIQPGARRIAFSTYNDRIEVTAFQNPDHSIIVVLLNRNDIPFEFNLCYNDKVLHDNLDRHAIVTFVIDGE